MFALVARGSHCLEFTRPQEETLLIRCALSDEYRQLMLFRFFLVRLNYKKWSVRRKMANAYLLRPHLPPQNLFQTQHQSRRCCRYNTLGSCQSLTKDLNKFIVFFQLQEMEKKRIWSSRPAYADQFKIICISHQAIVKAASLLLHFHENSVIGISSRISPLLKR